MRTQYVRTGWKRLKVHALASEVYGLGMLLALVAATLDAVPGAGQSVALSPVALGTALSGTGFARSPLDFRLNPAVLATAPPGWAARAPQFAVTSDLRPVTWSDLAEYSGAVVPDPVRQDWLRAIRETGNQRGQAIATLTPVLLARAPFALRVSTSFSAAAHLNPDAAQALLFGNVGLTGEADPLRFDGSGARAAWISRIDVAWGHGLDRLSSALRGWSVGVSVNAQAGHSLFLAQDAGSGIQTAPDQVDVVLPVLETGTRSLVAGWGMGMDVGLRGSVGPWQIDAVVHDAWSRFDWSEPDLRYRVHRVLLGPDSIVDGADERPLSQAPLALRAGVQSVHPRASFTLAAGRPVGSSTGAAAELRCGPAPNPLAIESVRICGLGVGVQRVLAPRWLVRGGLRRSKRGTSLGGGLGVGWSWGALDLAGRRRFGAEPGWAAVVALDWRRGRG